ncbi:hypothetical protein Cni_G26856 [Canna indica]|uniref:Mitochondrial inner membrane protease subunit 2 n=1 Tax=Canna indica TaxID=4628 RepID=A0AAQ3KZQ5_9LILI|nr:hypothetical protein Cni_G26856 [Canna indica]
MVSLSTWCRYAVNKLEYSLFLNWRNYYVGKINAKEFYDDALKNFFNGKMTFCHWNKGEEMAPTLVGDGGTLLVRKLPFPSPTQVFVGDVVMLKNPTKTDDYFVRRVAALEGCEMVSSNDKDEPFILEKDQCWVLADNESLKPKEAQDSRIFGPVPMTDIVGRVIYALRNAVDHGPVYNSHMAIHRDASVLAVELDVEEMVKKMKS